MAPFLTSGMNNAISMDYCYLNDEILQFGDCNLHISDLLIQRGYGVFDFFRCRNGQIPWLEDYADRFYTSLELSGIETPANRQRFTSIIHDLYQRNGMENSAFKVIATGGSSDNLDFVTGPPNLIILNVPWKSPPPESFEQGVKLISCEYQRPHPEIKSLYYLNTLMLQQKLKEYGAVDVLYHTDYITEASRASLFLVKGGTIFTPASNILKGITRKQVLSLVSGIQVVDIESERLFEFDEMFITSTSRDVTPVVSVDGKKVGDGQVGNVTKDVMSAFRNQGW